MNHSKLYVPDAQKWIEFLKQMSTKQKLIQTGGGRMLHITPTRENINTKSVTLNSVAPAQQTVEQAKSELKREDINPTIVEKTIHKTNSCSKRHIKNSASHRKNSVKKSTKKVKKSGKKTHKISFKRKEIKRKEFKKNLKKQSDKKQKNIKNKISKQRKNIKNLLKKDILGY